MHLAGRESDVLEPPTLSQQGHHKEGKQPVKHRIDKEQLNDELTCFVNIKDNKKSPQRRHWRCRLIDHMSPFQHHKINVTEERSNEMNHNKGSAQKKKP